MSLSLVDVTCFLWEKKVTAQKSRGSEIAAHTKKSTQRNAGAGGCACLAAARRSGARSWPGVHRRHQANQCQSRCGAREQRAQGTTRERAQGEASSFMCGGLNRVVCKLQTQACARRFRKFRRARARRDGPGDQSVLAGIGLSPRRCQQ